MSRIFLYVASHPTGGPDDGLGVAITAKRISREKAIQLYVESMGDPLYMEEYAMTDKEEYAVTVLDKGKSGLVVFVGPVGNFSHFVIALDPTDILLPIKHNV